MDKKIKYLFKVKDADEETRDIGQFEMDDVIFVAELMNKNINGLVENEEYEGSVIFYGHEFCGVYDNEEDFRKEQGNMAAESFIPMGAFPANPEDKNWKPSPMNYMNSTIVDVVPDGAIGQSEEYLFFTSKIMETELNQCFFFPNLEEKPNVKPGQIISGVYWAELTLKNEEGDNKPC